MTWRNEQGRYTLMQDEYRLRVWLEPAVPVEIEPGDLGSAEHPFVWRFEVEHREDGLEFRGVRETLAEAQRTALNKVSEQLPELPLAFGY